MPKRFLSVFLISLVILGGYLLLEKAGSREISGAPPYGESAESVPDLSPYNWVLDWKRPDGPSRVGIQVGHWKSNELPDELVRIRGNTGSSGGGKWEWEVSYEIAMHMKTMLEEKGVSVDILPATVPPDYWADVFIAVHADGSLDRGKSGFKIAAPWRDYTGKSGKLVEILRGRYKQATGLAWDDNITRNMRGYYAFSWWRYDHAIHPMTTAVIVETGFLTNASDRKLIVDNPEVSAEALSDGILEFLVSEGLI